LAILRMIQWAKLQGFDYLYLGFFIPGHPKMDYKFRYHPAEILDPRTMHWRKAREFMGEVFPHYPV
jgi:arginine-tRNA-protein transferase